MAKVAQLPPRAAPVPVAPAEPTPIQLGRNVVYTIEGEGDYRTLVIMVNIGDSSVRNAPLSKEKPDKPNAVRNPNVGNSGGFKYVHVAELKSDIGINLNVIAKPER